VIFRTRVVKYIEHVYVFFRYLKKKNKVDLSKNKISVVFDSSCISNMYIIYARIRPPLYVKYKSRIRRSINPNKPFARFRGSGCFAPP